MSDMSGSVSIDTVILILYDSYQTVDRYHFREGGIATTNED